jgi:hypothetical protein
MGVNNALPFDDLFCLHLSIQISGSISKRRCMTTAEVIATKLKELPFIK